MRPHLYNMYTMLSFAHLHISTYSHACTLQLTAVKRSFNPLIFPFFDSRVCSLCGNPSVLYELSLELESAKIASEKVTELLFQSMYAASKIADMETELFFYGNAFENAGRV